MFRKLMAAGFALVATASAVAQGLPSAPHLTLSQRSSFLLMASEARESLRLTAQQGTSVDSAMGTLAKVQSMLFAKAPIDEKALADADRRYAQAVWSALSGPQQVQLLQMAVKEVGVLALADKEIAARLRITDAQAKALEPLLAETTAREENWNEMIAKGMEHFLPPKDEQERAAQARGKADVLKSYEAQRQIHDAEQAKTAEKVVAVLDAAQRKLWQELAG